MSPTAEDNNSVDTKQYKKYIYKPVSVSQEIDSNQCDKNSKEDTQQSTMEDRIIFNSQNLKIPESINTENGSKFLQYFAAIAANLCIVAGGAMLGWTSSSLSKLEQDNPIADDNPLGVAITKDETSWIGSLTPLGAIFGSFLAGYLADRCGRKKTLLLSAFLFTTSWILIATAKTVETIYVARFISGLGIAIPFVVLPIYTSEIAETEIRGLVGSLLQPFISIGLLLAYSVGPYVSYTIFWIVCSIFPILFFVIFYYMPESPYYLAAKGRDDQVINVLVKLRGKNKNSVKAEADHIQKTVEDAYKCEATFMDLFRVNVNFKALLLTISLIVFQQFAGINVVIFYSQKIFDAAGTSSSLSSAVSTIIIGICSFLPSLITPFIVDRWGRKILLNTSAIGCCISLMSLGLFFYLLEYGDVSNISWLPVVSLMTYIVSYSWGYGPLPWSIMGEMFAPDVKSKASSITACISWTLAFIITKYFSNIADAFGMFTAFWIFSLSCFISVLFMVFLLPETKGKSLSDIQAELGGYSSHVINDKKNLP